MNKTRTGRKFKHSLPTILEIKEETTGKMTELNVNLMMKVIPPYDGNAETLHQFLNCADIINKPLKAKDKPTFLLSTKLTGKAYIIMQYKKHTAYEDLREELLRQFRQEKTLGEIQLQLTNSRQGSRIVLEIANEIEQLTSDLNTAAIATAGEAATATVTLLDTSVLHKWTTKPAEDYH